MRFPLTLLLVLLAVAPATASAATFTADPALPDSASDGDCATAGCTLRDAFGSADAADGNTVKIPAGTYTLTEGVIAFSVSMTVEGAGARSTVIDGNDATRLFDVGADGKTLTFRDLTLTRGRPSAGQQAPQADGGAIIVDGDVTLERVAITNSSAPFGGGGLATETPEFSPTLQPPSATVKLVDSLVSGNSATGTGDGQGGGIYAYGKLTLVNTTVTRNRIEATGVQRGAGVISFANPGYGVTTELVNSTIAGNSASLASATGAGLAGNDVATFSNDTTAVNSIVAGNLANGAENDCGLLTTSTTDNNLSGDATCGFTDAGSKQSTDAKLTGLGNRTGPVDVLRPAPDSPAIDAGVAGTCQAADARGIKRPQRGACDLGAVEVVFASAATSAPIDVTQREAKMVGTAANPTPENGVAYFEYGTTANYTTRSAEVAIPAGTSAAALASQLVNLTPGTTYHYRLVVRTPESGAVAGADQTITTAATPAAVPRQPVECRSTRRVRIRFTDLVRRALSVTLGGRKLRVTGTSTPTVLVDLTGRPKGTYTVRISGRGEKSGRKVSRTRKFKTCTAGTGSRRR